MPPEFVSDGKNTGAEAEAAHNSSMREVVRSKQPVGVDNKPVVVVAAANNNRRATEAEAVPMR